MKLSRRTLAVALLVALAAPAAHAEIAIDVIGGSEVSFEGLVQADCNSFDSDVVEPQRRLRLDGEDSDIRNCAAPSWCSRARARATSSGCWATTPRPTSSSTSTSSTSSAATPTTSCRSASSSSRTAWKSCPSTKNNDFISKASITNTCAVAAPPRRRLRLRHRQLGRDGQLLRPRTDPQPGARQRLQPARLLGADQRQAATSCTSAWPTRTTTPTPTPSACAPVRMADLAPRAPGRRRQHDRRDRDRHDISLEGMWVTGPFKLQAEYMTAATSSAWRQQRLQRHGCYVSGLWNITGETWGYKGGVPTTPASRTSRPPACGSWACATTPSTSTTARW